jgi:predicted AAA+ superfamily ATPase
MLPRLLKTQIDQRLCEFPAVAIVGPRQAGKTTLARTFSTLYFDLEQERDRVQLDLRWESLVNGDQLVILDEAQSWPEVFSRLRGAIDQDRARKGRFLLLGSVAPALMREVSESLAGRIAVVDLSPLIAAELPTSSQDALWRFGGFPDGGVLQAQANSFPVWQDSYLKQMAQRDLPLWGLPAKPAETERLLKLTAALNGCSLNYSQLGQSLGISYHTVQGYLDYLEGAFLIRRLLPYFANNFPKRLTKAPKLYWRDSGLLHALMGYAADTDLTTQPWVGASWESWVIEQIISTRQATGEKFQAWYFRTNDGLECDLVIESGSEREIIEIKLASGPDSANFRKLEKIAHLVGATRQVMLTRVRDEDTVMTGNRWSANLSTYLERFSKRSVIPSPKVTTSTMSAGFLFEKLVEDAGAMVERGIVTRETLLKRAQWLKEDLDALAWEGFHILPKQWIHPPQTGLYHPLVEYKWGQTDHNIDKSDGDAFKHASSALAIEGTGLDRENIGHFGKVSQIGHTMIPHLWLSDRRLRDDVRRPTQHLDTLNEVWWLNAWQGVDSASVTREHLMRRDAENLAKPTPSTVDWRFTVLGGSMAINLSVKNRRGTAACRPFVKGVYLFNDSPDKPFSPSVDDEINILAITGYHGGWITLREQEELVATYLDHTLVQLDRPVIDAVVIWVRGAAGLRGGEQLKSPASSLTAYFPKSRPLNRKDLIVRAILKEVDIEDSSMIGVYHHLGTLEDVTRLEDPPRIIS